MNEPNGVVVLLAAVALLVFGDALCAEAVATAHDALPSIASGLLAWLATTLTAYGMLRLYAGPRQG